MLISPIGADKSRKEYGSLGDCSLVFKSQLLQACSFISGVEGLKTILRQIKLDKYKYLHHVQKRTKRLKYGSSLVCLFGRVHQTILTKQFNFNKINSIRSKGIGPTNSTLIRPYWRSVI